MDLSLSYVYFEYSVSQCDRCMLIAAGSSRESAPIELVCLLLAAAALVRPAHARLFQVHTSNSEQARISRRRSCFCILRCACGQSARAVAVAKLKIRAAAERSAATQQRRCQPFAPQHEAAVWSVLSQACREIRRAAYTRWLRCLWATMVAAYAHLLA